MSCDHKFIDSNTCAKCGVHVEKLRAADAAERSAFEKAVVWDGGPVPTEPVAELDVRRREKAAPSAVTRAHAQKLAEQSILTIAHNLDEIDQKDYAGAFKQLRTFMAHVADDVEKNKLDTGSVMLLGAACITLLREAVVKFPAQVKGATMPTELPGEGS